VTISWMKAEIGKKRKQPGEEKREKSGD